MTNITKLTTEKPQTVRTVDALEAVRQALSDHLNGLPVATAIGVLEIVKHGLLTEPE